jgi:hypothetical protein
MVVTIMFWLYCLVITLICIFIFAACRLAGDADEAAKASYRTQFTPDHPIGCCCHECEDRMAQTYDGFGRPYKHPVHLETLLDNSCGELGRLPEQKEAV